MRAGILSMLLLLAGCGDDQSGAAAPPAEWTAGVGGLNDGKALFEVYCTSCHGAGPGYPGTMRLRERLGEEQAVLLNREALPAEYIKTVVREGFQLMPPFRPTEITDSQLEALADYITGQESG